MTELQPAMLYFLCDDIVSDCIDLERSIDIYGIFDDDWTCDITTDEGKINVLKWLRAKGHRWNSKNCSNAIKSGNMNLFRWLLGQGCPWNPDDACTNAAKSGSLDSLKIMRNS